MTEPMEPDATFPLALRTFSIMATCDQLKVLQHYALLSQPDNERMWTVEEYWIEAVMHVIRELRANERP